MDHDVGGIAEHLDAAGALRRCGVGRPRSAPDFEHAAFDTERSLGGGDRTARILRAFEGRRVRARLGSSIRSEDPFSLRRREP